MRVLVVEEVREVTAPRAARRNVPLSITLTPTAKAGERLSPEAQISLVRQTIFSLRANCFQKWNAAGILFRAHIGSEVGEAHPAVTCRGTWRYSLSTTLATCPRRC